MWLEAPDCFLLLKRVENFRFMELVQMKFFPPSSDSSKRLCEYGKIFSWVCPKQ